MGESFKVAVHKKNLKLLSNILAYATLRILDKRGIRQILAQTRTGFSGANQITYLAK